MSALEPRIVLAGSVSSSRRTLQGLLRNHANVIGALSLSPQAAGRVSGYCRLDDLARSEAIPHIEFQNINHPTTVAAIRDWEPDLLFVVGLSQLVEGELLAVPRVGCVGFHPTRLPEGRGRAPIAWLTLDSRPGAATFFLMDKGIDSGAILSQEPFHVSPQDYASEVIAKMESAIDVALDRWLPRLLRGEWQPTPQDSGTATYNGRRAAEDGLIDWHVSAQQIHAVIRATSRPHPGAYTYAGEHKLIVWRAEIEPSLSFRGVIGRVVVDDPNKGLLVQTGDGLLWLTETEIISGTDTPVRKPWVGVKLGYSAQNEIFFLKQKVDTLEARLLRVENTENDTDTL